MTTSASSVRPEPVTTDSPCAAATVSPVRTSTPWLLYCSVTKDESPSGSTRDAIPASGKIIVTRQPFTVSAAAISEPMKPPPTTTARAPSRARARTAR